MEDDTESIDHRRPRCERATRTLEFINDNIGKSITLTELSAVAALSPYHFSRKFKSLMGKSPMKFILDRRIAAAKIMLLNNETTCKIAYKCGFASQSHFCTSFKSVTGMTATKWRKTVLRITVTIGVAPVATELALMVV